MKRLLLTLSLVWLFYDGCSFAQNRTIRYSGLDPQEELNRWADAASSPDQKLLLIKISKSAIDSVWLEVPANKKIDIPYIYIWGNLSLPILERWPRYSDIYDRGLYSRGPFFYDILGNEVECDSVIYYELNLNPGTGKAIKTKWKTVANKLKQGYYEPPDEIREYRIKIDRFNKGKEKERPIHPVKKTKEKIKTKRK